MSALTPAPAGSGSVRTAAPIITNSRRWTIVLLLFLASMINYLDRATISFALPMISESLGLDAILKGVLISAFFWSYALMQVPMGWMADRYNLKWLYAGAFTLWSVAQGLTGLATGLGMLIAFRILLGIGEAIYLPGGTKTVSLLFPLSERGLPCGLFDFGTRTAVVLEALLIPWLLHNFGWRATFAVLGFTALLWLVPWLLVTPRRMQAPPENAAVPAELDLADQNPRRYRDLFGICLGFFCFDWYWYLLVFWLPDYLVNVRKLTIIWAGLYSALPFLVFGLSQPIGGWIGDRLVRAGGRETIVRKGIVSVSFLTGLMLIPAAQAATPESALFFLTLGCLVGLSTANQLVILQGCAPRRQVGLWTGIYNFAGNIAGILAPIATGFIIHKTGSYTPAFVLAALMLAAGQLSYWFLVGEVKPRQADMLAGAGAELEAAR